MCTSVTKWHLLNRDVSYKMKSCSTSLGGLDAVRAPREYPLLLVKKVCTI